MRDNRNMLLIFYDVVTRSCPTENIKSQKLFFFYILNNLDNRRTCFFLPLVYFFFLSGNWISTKGFRNVDLTFRKTFPCRSSVEIQPVRCNPLYFSGERLYPFPTIETNPELCVFFSFVTQLSIF